MKRATIRTSAFVQIPLSGDADIVIYPITGDVEAFDCAGPFELSLIYREELEALDISDLTDDEIAILSNSLQFDFTQQRAA